MYKLTAFALSALFAANVAFAQAPAVPAKAAASDCEAQAVSKEGKPLHGAAKAASIKKCVGAGGTVAATKPAAKAAKPAAAATASGCAEKAVGKNGKPLAGAAKSTFMKKCEADAKAAR